MRRKAKLKKALERVVPESMRGAAHNLADIVPDVTVKGVKKTVEGAVKKAAGLQRKGGPSDDVMGFLYPDYDPQHDYVINTSEDEELVVPALNNSGKDVTGYMVKDHIAKLMQALETPLPPGDPSLPGMPLGSTHPRPDEDEEPLQVEEGFFGGTSGSSRDEGEGKGKGRAREVLPRALRTGDKGNKDDDRYLAEDEGEDKAFSSDGKLIEAPVKTKKGELGGERDFISGRDW